MIKDDFLSVLGNYEIQSYNYNKLLGERKEMKRKGELSTIERLSKKNYTTADLLENIIPKELIKIASLRNNLKVKGSAGNGYMSDVPHICVFDTSITTSAQKGYYIVYLFYLPSRQVFLSLNQGFTEYLNLFGEKEGKQRARNNALLAQKLLRSIEGFNFGPLPWNAKKGLADGYKNGNICFKEYGINNFPDDTEFVDDLRNLLGIYRELKGLVGSSLFQIKADITEDNYQEEIQSSFGYNLPTGPIPFSNIESEVQKKKAIPRNIQISAQALSNASYKCENDPTHQTFFHISGHQFVEAHHLIPLEFQIEFDNKLDVPENILSLCPNCHRAFHHSNFERRQSLVSKFWNMRKQQLVERGLSISLEKIISYYKITEIENIGGDTSNNQ